MMQTTVSLPNSLHRSIKQYLIEADFSLDEFMERTAKQYLKLQANQKTLAALNKVYGVKKNLPTRT